MNIRFARIAAAALCTAVLLGGIFPAPALADQPIFYFEENAGTFEIGCGGGLIIYDEFTAHGEGRTYLDQDGNPIKTWVQIWVSTRFYTNQNSLEIYTGPFTYNGFYYYDADGELTKIKGQGNMDKVIVPGYGNIAHWAGMVIVDADYNILKVTPKLEPAYEGDYSRLCAYFAGELP